MGAKSRGGWPVSICLKDCGNRDVMCKSCRRFSNLIAPLKVDAVSKEFHDGKENHARIFGG
jgi:hypothetical protein